MMNDIMEKLIKNNREKLMSDLPAGHRERFEMKMMSQRDNETTSRCDNDWKNKEIVAWDCFCGSGVVNLNFN